MTFKRLENLCLTHWLSELFAKNAFSGQIWAQLAPIYSKRHLQHDSTPFFSLALRFTTFSLGHMQKSKFSDRFWTRKLPTPLAFFNFFLFFLFLLFLSLTLYWACFRLKNFQESIVAMCSGGKFCSEFVTQIYEHFVHISGFIRQVTLNST